MSARRPGISAGRSGVSWAAKHMEVSAPVATCALSPVVTERIAHPVIAQTQARGYQVMRRYRDADGIGHELIGETPDMLVALRRCDRELGAAIVRDLNCKAIYTNGQPVEAR